MLLIQEVPIDSASLGCTSLVMPKLLVHEPHTEWTTIRRLGPIQRVEAKAQGSSRMGSGEEAGILMYRDKVHKMSRESVLNDLKGGMRVQY